MFVDIHSHIIPGIDDGAEDIEQAVQMLRTAYENGTGHIIATPHFISGNTDLSQIDSSSKKLQQLAVGKGINLAIHSGCEAFLNPDLPKLYEEGKIFTLNQSSYMLIELPMMSIPPYTDFVLYELQLKGIIPIIAHPERNREIIENPIKLRDMVSRGILSQVNSGSVTGLFGNSVQKVAMRLIKLGCTHFIASDSHSNSRRSPDLSKAASIVEKVFGSDIMMNIFSRNGMKVLQNQRITKG